MRRYLLVNGNFVPTGGMDMPNLALAMYLAERGDEVHLVTHSVDEQLSSLPNVFVHLVPKPANSYLLAAPIFDRIGRHWAAKIAARNGRVVVNGGNCRWGDINWVHYVHAAFQPPRAGGALRILKNEGAHKIFLAYERDALKQARMIITNSELTRRNVIERLGIEAARVKTVYLGIDAEKFRPPTEQERKQSRQKLGWPDSKPVIAFIGALGDRRKGLDKIFAAWKILCADNNWDADLVVIGTGAELSAWRARAAEAGLQSRIHFLGFREDVPSILAASDAMVAPTRYEAYGQAVHEALCCGLPSLVTRTSGVAERYPAELSDLLLDDPPHAEDIVHRLRHWRANMAGYSQRVAHFGEMLRQRTWKDMAREMVELIQ